MNFVSKVLLENKNQVKCEKCGKSFNFQLGEDCVIYIPTGEVRTKCPHCNQYYNISFSFRAVQNGKKAN